MEGISPHLPEMIPYLVENLSSTNVSKIEYFSNISIHYF